MENSILHTYSWLARHCAA